MRLSRLTAASLSVLLIAACGQPVEPASAPAEPAAPAAPAAPQPPAMVLTPAGLGPVAIGMTEAQVRAALGADRIEGDTGSDFDTCKEMQLKGDLAGTWVMFEDGKVTRVSIGEGSTVKTDKGLGLGATADQVRAAYGAAVKAEPHKYEGPPAEYLTIWAVPDKSGVQYETNEQRVVKTIHAGGPSILYIEGCA